MDLENSQKILRIDDFGAASRTYEWHAGRWPVVFPLNHRKLLGHWGPFREMSENEIRTILKFCQSREVGINFSVTSLYAVRSSLRSIMETYPSQVAELRKGVSLGYFSISNHGLTHCQHNRWQTFFPVTNNREFHREFGSYLSEKKALQRISIAQKILASVFGETPNLFVPPGHHFECSVDPVLLSSIGLGYVATDSVFDSYRVGKMKFLNRAKFSVLHTRDVIGRNDYDIYSILESALYK